MALGEQLRNARLARKETVSQVASATRILVQQIEAIEREDFSRFPAVIYGKGFIRLYAEHVGLDPKPLIAEYLARVAASPPSPALHEKPRGLTASLSDTRQEERAPSVAVPLPVSPSLADMNPEADFFSRVRAPVSTPRFPSTPSPGSLVWSDARPSVSSSDKGSSEALSSLPTEPPARAREYRLSLRVAWVAIRRSADQWAGVLRRVLHGMPALFTRTVRWLNLTDLLQSPVRLVGVVLTVVAVLILLGSSLHRLMASRKTPHREADQPYPSMQILREPPVPYFD